MNKKVREMVWERSKGICECCGRYLDPENWSFSHRKATKQGGEDAPENGMATHWEPCHRVDVELHPHSANEKGWRVRSSQNPKELPILLYGKLWIFLEPDGTYRKPFNAEINPHQPLHL